MDRCSWIDMEKDTGKNSMKCNVLLLFTQLTLRQHNWPSDRSLFSEHLWFQSYVLKFKRMNVPRCLFNAESCVQKQPSTPGGPRWATEDDVLCRRPPDYIHGTAYQGAARNANAGFPRHYNMPNLQCPVYGPSSLMTWWICHLLCVRLLVFIIVCYYMSRCH